MALAGQTSNHVVQRAVASASTVSPRGDEPIPGIPDNGKSEISGGGRGVFRAQHPIVHEGPIWVAGIEVESVNDRRSSAFSLVYEMHL